MSFLFFKPFQRELLIQVRQIRFLVNSCLFFFMLLFFFPLALGSQTLIRTLAPGLIWIALLLSVLLSTERLFLQDYEQGIIEQWLLSGHSLPLLIGAKVLAQCLCILFPLLVLCPLWGLLFSLSAWETLILLLSLLCGTPALFFLSALASAFGVGVHQKGVLMALILLPLILPLLLLGSATLSLAMQGLPVSAYLALLSALSLLALGFLPSAMAGIIRISCVD